MRALDHLFWAMGQPVLVARGKTSLKRHYLVLVMVGLISFCLIVGFLGSLESSSLLVFWVLVITSKLIAWLPKVDSERELGLSNEALPLLISTRGCAKEEGEREYKTCHVLRGVWYMHKTFFFYKEGEGHPKTMPPHCHLSNDDGYRS